MTTGFLFTVVRTAMISLSSGLVFLVILRKHKGLSPNTHRLIWFGVLLLGLCVVRLPIDVPYYEAPTAIATPAPIIAVPDESRTMIMPEIPTTFTQQPKKIASKHNIEHNIIEAQPVVVQTAMPLSWPMVLMAVWGMGIVTLLSRRAVLFVRLHFKLRKLAAVEVPEWQRLLKQFGIAPEKIPVFWTGSSGPALVRTMSGYRLLFPRSLWDELSPVHREGVLRHELAHYLGGDAFVMEMARLLATLQWFNPISWVALRRLEEATEWRCDDFAYFNRESGPQELIETLLAVHESTESLGLYLSSFARINVITRIQRLLHISSRKENTLMKKLILPLLFLTLLMCSLLQVNLTAKQPTEASAALSTVQNSNQDENGGYLYLKNVKTTLKGEKVSYFIDPMNVIAKHLEARTEKKWWCTNSTLSMLMGDGITKPRPNEICVFPAKKPDYRKADWYKITINKEGVLIQSNTETGLEAAAEHFIELLDGASDDLRLPVGVFTSNNRHFSVNLEPQTKETTIRGRVFLPDGSPAKNYYVAWKYMNLTKNSSVFSGTFTNDEGEYITCAMPVGARMLAVVKNGEKKSEWLENGLAAPILSGIVKKNPTEGEYDIHLQKGVRVGGTLRYEDGTPAANKTVLINVYGFGGESFTLPEKDELGRDNFTRPCLYQHVYSDENGNYTFWLVPDGVYEIEQNDLSDESRRQTLELAADETERTIDFRLPQATTLHFAIPDGTLATDVEVDISSRMAENERNRNIVKLQPEADGNYRVVLSSIANLISVKTPDGKFGVHRLVKDDDRLEPVSITLQPAVTAKIRLLNASTDEPIAGKRLACCPHLRIHSMLLLINGEMLEEIQTDENGVATVKNLYIGDVEYTLYDGHSSAKDYFQQTIVPPQTPGVTIDLGDVRIEEEPAFDPVPAAKG